MPDGQSSNLPPHIQLIQMGRAHVVAKSVYVAAKLGLADQLAPGPKSAAELAGAIHAHAPSLHRLMRTLASMGILTEQTEQRFALTDLGAALRTGAPGSARSSVLISASPWAQSGWDNMLYSVQTGKTGFEKAHGVLFFDYLAQHPEDASLFSEMMVGPIVRSRRPSLPPTIFLASRPLSTLAARQEICWPPSLPVTPGRAAYCSTGRMWCRTPQRCLTPKA